MGCSASLEGTKNDFLREHGLADLFVSPFYFLEHNVPEFPELFCLLAMQCQAPIDYNTCLTVSSTSYGH